MHGFTVKVLRNPFIEACGIRKSWLCRRIAKKRKTLEVLYFHFDESLMKEELLLASFCADLIFS